MHMELNPMRLRGLDMGFPASRATKICEARGYQGRRYPGTIANVPRSSHRLYFGSGERRFSLPIRISPVHAQFRHFASSRYSDCIWLGQSPLRDLRTLKSAPLRGLKSRHCSRHFASGEKRTFRGAATPAFACHQHQRPWSPPKGSHNP
jgi:hypothetical protein